VRLTPSIERTPVTLGGDVGHGRYRVVSAGPVVTVTGMASPNPPDPEPEAIRAGLSQQMRYEFDREWDYIMDEAKHDHSLAGVHDFLEKWRLFACAELRVPPTVTPVSGTEQN
jgi:hypothetical protein